MKLPQVTKQNAKKRAESIAKNRALLVSLPEMFTAQEAKSILANFYHDLRTMEKQGLIRSEGARLNKLYFKVSEK